MRPRSRSSRRECGNPGERRGDLRAQLGANRLASRRLEELCARRGAASSSSRRWTELHDYAERRVRAAIAALPDGRFEASDVLEAEEGDLEVRAAVTIDGDELEIDFAGTGAAARGEPQLPTGGGRGRPVTSSSAV